MKTLSALFLGALMSGVATFAVADTTNIRASSSATANETDARQVYSTVGSAAGNVETVIEGPINWHIVANQGPQSSCYIYSRPLNFSTSPQNIPDLEGLNMDGVAGPIEYKPEQDQMMRAYLEEGRRVRGGGAWGTILNRTYLQKERARNEEQGLSHDWNLEQRRYPYFDDRGEIIWLDGNPRTEMAIFVLWPDNNITSRSGEFSAQTGVQIKQGMGQHALVVSGRARYTLYAEGTNLYAHPKDDAAIISDLRAGTEAQIVFELENGDVLMDEYSLWGMVAATSEAGKRCD